MKEFMRIHGKGLKFEISCIEETIRLKEEQWKGTTFEKGLVKVYKKELEQRQETARVGVANPNLVA